METMNLWAGEVNSKINSKHEEFTCKITVLISELIAGVKIWELSWHWKYQSTIPPLLKMAKKSNIFKNMAENPKCHLFLLRPETLNWSGSWEIWQEESPSHVMEFPSLWLVIWIVTRHPGRSTHSTGPPNYIL